MAIGLTGHPWSIAELMDASAAAEPQEPEPQPTPVPPIMPSPVPMRPQFRVIQGGRT
jgi:hypothetical protein